MEGWVGLAALVLALAWAALVYVHPRAAFDPRCLLLLNTLSAFLCPLWMCEDPSFDSSLPFYGTGYTRRAASCVLLAVLAAVYLMLSAGHLARLRPASSIAH